MANKKAPAKKKRTIANRKSEAEDSFAQKIFQAGSDPLSPLEKPELVFGIVGPVGVDRELVCSALQTELIEYGYTVHRIRVSKLITLIPRYSNIEAGCTDEFNRIEKYMSAGTSVREDSGLGDALAILAMSEISSIRTQENLKNGIPEGRPEFAHLIGRPATAYILDSLKHPDEVQSLRATYGRGFMLISAYAARENRIESLASRIAYSRVATQEINTCRADAEILVSRDEKEEGNKLGQNVLNTFPMADLFIDIGSKTTPFTEELSRFCEIIFNNPFITPKIDEFGMFHAEAASWRSADLSRQVGASICMTNGTLRAVGCNEVPAAGGGLYWENDSNDDRDFRRGLDEGTRQKNLMVAEILNRISEVMTSKKDKKALAELMAKVLAGDEHPTLNGIQALNVIEYGRAVHAEMAALSEAARNGITVQDHTMYVNTFPCHICARHIIASGIKRVIYIQPYPKSFTRRLFNDSVVFDENQSNPEKVLFQPFSGVAPRMYQFAFELTKKRKGENGNSIKWTKLRATTKLKRFVFSYIVIENQILTALLPQIK